MAGGISGHGDSRIINCYNTGNIEATMGFVGGIAGYNYKEITNCYNTGNISSLGDNIGGIAGECYAGSNRTIYNCYNIGIVSGKNGVGGILGNVTSTPIQLVDKCYNLGAVSGNNGVSGIIGKTNVKATTVSNCYNMAKITGTTSSSGIIYKLYNDTNAKVISCYNIGVLEAKNKYGITNRTIVENCYYLNTCGATDSNGISISSEDLKNLASTLDKAYTINSETGEVTISETEIQNVWTNDTQNKNDGYPIFK